MSRRRKRQSYAGCAVQHHREGLRLRYRIELPDGRTVQRSCSTGLADTAENRATLDPLAKLVGKLIDNGKDPAPYLKEHLGQADPATPPLPPLGPTVETYFREWYAEREKWPKKKMKPARLRDYRRHIEAHVLPSLGDQLLADIRPKDVRGLQAELLARVSPKTGKVLTEKYVKNILCGSFQAMVRQARTDDFVLRDLFEGLEWTDYDPPEPDPCDADERDRILEHFRTKRFGFHPGRTPDDSKGMRPHPHFHAYLHMLFWHGCRPSEASGFRWPHIDLKRAVAHVRESYHMGNRGKPKTLAARRTIQLHPETVTLLRALQPLRVRPDMPVFLSTTGTPIEPKTFSEHWYDALRILGIRQRGLYATKDTFVTLALSKKREDVMLWLVQQTGVAYETLRKHYFKSLPTPDAGMWRHLDPRLREGRERVREAS
jgi:integrase